MSRFAGALTVGIVLTLSGAGSAFANGEETIAVEVVIESTGVWPPLLLVEPERRVWFVNRSGRRIHIQFMMRNDEQHTLVQVPEQIWAIFHQVGRHPFAVHFLDRAVPDLFGTVEVVGDPYGRPDPLVCSGITVMGACLER